MGCGGSKLEHENDANNNIRPIFHTRLEEFIARRYGGNNCKKQIIASNNNNNNVNVQNETSSIMQEEDVLLSPPSLPLPLPSPPPSPPHPTISMDDNNNGLMFQQTQDFPPSLQIVSPNFDNNCDHSNVSSTNQVLKDDNVSHNNNNNNVEDNVNDDGDKEQNLCEIKVSKESLEDGEMEYFDDLVGSSPSFRVYCIQSVLVDDELDEIAELHSNELLEEDEKDCLSQESSNSNEVEVVEDKEVLKKHKRGIMKLRMITIPKVGLGKSIMHNMHSLYPFSSGSNNHHSQ